MSRLRETISKCVDLQALSSRQQRLIERHMPLVSLTLRRHFRHRGHFHGRHDLHQDGCIALAECIRNHEPQRHGEFEPYAMARIRYSVSRALHEEGLVRVPYSTQRRKRARDLHDTYRFDPSKPPMTLLMTDRQLGFLFPIRDQSPVSKESVNPARVTLGDVVRACCEEAMRKTLAELQRGAMRDDSALLGNCADQRWTVPEHAFKRSYRQLADDLKCGLSRIVRRERAFFRKVSRRLLCDRRFVATMRLARGHPAGLRHVPATDVLRAIESMNDTG